MGFITQIELDLMRDVRVPVVKRALSAGFVLFLVQNYCLLAGRAYSVNAVL